jgi:hypothetical protein
MYGLDGDNPNQRFLVYLRGLSLDFGISPLFIVYMVMKCDFLSLSSMDVVKGD